MACKHQCIQCDVTTCAHHAADGLCALESIRIAPRRDCHSGTCDESQCSNYTRG